jgi:hypothetical protein
MDSEQSQNSSVLNPDYRTVREWTADCPRAVFQQPRKIASHFNLPICGQIFTNYHEIGEHAHKAVGELPLRGHRPI